MSSPVRVAASLHTLALKAPFRISGYEFNSCTVLRVDVTDGAQTGRGEACGVYYLGDGPQRMLAMVEKFRSAVEAGLTRDALRKLMPPGGARNALDCALWELEARASGTSVWELAGLAAPSAVRSSFTIGADSPEAMARNAAQLDFARALKVKLTGNLALDLDRVRAIRDVRPECWMGVDGNQGFEPIDLDPLVTGLVAEGVSLLEQPLKRGAEAALEDHGFPIPLAADESFLTLADVGKLKGRFEIANIKLDKCGGLTEALLIAAALRSQGIGVMVGCMTGSSLAMAPAFCLAQVCDLVDLDAPIFLAEDIKPSVSYEDGQLWAGEAVWGGPALTSIP